MKIFLSALILMAATAGSIRAQEGPVMRLEDPKPRRSITGGFDSSMSGVFRDNFRQFGWGLLMYAPNRICDVLDLVTLRVSAGSRLGGGLQVTDFFQFRGEAGESGFAGLGFDRQWGGGVYNGFSYGILWFNRENYEISDAIGWQRNFRLADRNMRIPSLSEERFRNRDLDPWAIGVNLSVILGFEAKIHLIAIPDLLLGLLMFDPDNDDF